MQEIDIYLHPAQPMKMLLEAGPHNRFLIDITDASQFSDQEELAWKKANPIYSSTSPLDHYYLLKVEHLEIKDVHIEEDELVQMFLKVLLAAAEHWHELVIERNN
ncbi:MAG: hypothetical protein IPM52_03740 [Bacteroidetes bacterium]|nr:hypothetical protein [Bacteroidota bacterium]